MSVQSNPNKAPHILSASSNLLGLCFIVLTSIHVLRLADATIVDNLSTVAILLFMVSCITSFMSLRSHSRRGLLYERIADIFFMGGLLSIFIITVLVAFGAIH